MKLCSVEGCDREAESRGWCHKHYMQWRRHGADRPTCLVDDCTSPASTRSMCPKHYDRWRLYGDPQFVQRIRGDTVRRFWSKVNKVESGCWEWVGVINKAGYATLGIGARKQVYGHRFAYELLVGPIPDGLSLDHLCRNTRCVNPEHLEPVTQRENTLRGVGPAAVNAKKTHCKNGHEFNDENTYIDGKGYRICRTCHRAWKRAWAERKTAS